MPRHGTLQRVSLPRTLQLASLVLVVGALASPLILAAPLVPDVLNGAGTVSTFEVFGAGVSIEGGAHDWTDICSGCLIRMTVGEGAFTVVDPSVASDMTPILAPGVYEIREFRGIYAFSVEGQHAFIVQLHGLGKIARLD